MTALAAPARAVIIALWVAVGLLHLAWALTTPVGSFNDDAIHLLLARAVGQGGFTLPDGLNAPASYPLPGFAILMAGPVRFLEPHWGLLRFFALGMTWIMVFCAWRLARKILPPTWALSCATLVALNNVLMLYAGALMPDVAYTAISLAILAAFPDEKNAPAPPMRLLLLAGAAGAAALFRPHGVLLILACGLALWARQGLRRCLVFSAPALALPGLWTLRNALYADAISGYIPYWATMAEELGPAGQLAHAGKVVAVYVGQGLLGLIPLPFPALLACGLGGLAVAALGAIRRIRDQHDPRVFAMAVYALAVMLLHFTWSFQVIRYLLPLLPILWILLLEGVRPSLEARPRLRALAALFFLGLFLRHDLAYLRGRSLETTWQPATMAWIRENVPLSGRFQSVYEGPLMLFTGRQALGLFANSTGQAHWLAQILFYRVEYVVADEAGLSTDIPWVAANPFVREVYRNPEEGSLIFRIQHPDPQRYLKDWDAQFQTPGP